MIKNNVVFSLMNKKKIVLSIIGIIMYFIIFSRVEAAGNVSLSSSKSTVNVGDTFNVSVNLSGASIASLTARVSVDTDKVEYVSGPNTSNFSNGRVVYTWTDPQGGASPITGGTIATFTFRAKSEGVCNFSVSGDFFTPEETSAGPTFSGVGVTISKANNQNDNQNNNQNSNTNSGNNNDPSNNGAGAVGGNVENSGNNSNTGTDNGTNNNASNGNSNNQNSGGSSNQSGGNSSQSSNNNLRSLQLDVEGISPAFNKNTTQYYITIPESVASINVTAQPEDSKASVRVTGNTDIPNGSSQIRIIVTAENGRAKEYVINVTKTNNPDLANTNLENLAVENATLTPEFSPDITDYTVEIFEDISELNILAVPQREAAQVSIEGNENLQYGENLVRVIVTSEDGKSTKVYNLNVIKSEDQIEEDRNEQDLIEKGNLVNDNTKKNNLITTIALVILAIVIIAVTVYVYKKINKRR